MLLNILSRIVFEVFPYFGNNGDFMRYPVVSNMFYPGDETALESFFLKAINKEAKASGEIIGAISPHAGYMYSGMCAGFTYSAIAGSFKEPPIFVILGPNHSGNGSGVSISLQDWKTPLGEVKLDKELAKAIRKHSQYADFDENAHTDEHSIEVQLPFLQHIYKNFTFVPISIMLFDEEVAEDLGKAIFEAEKEIGKRICVIASSDFTHYEPAKQAESKDNEALEKIKEFDAKGFFQLVYKNKYTICGTMPITVLLHYAKLKGGKKVEVLKYTNSGETTGDFSSVVAYVSAVMIK